MALKRMNIVLDGKRLQRDGKTFNLHWRLKEVDLNGL